jgi:hypothetical protein
MKRVISACVVVVLFISTCAANAQTPASGVRGQDYWMKYASRLPIGATVRVRTTDGDRMTAVLAIVDDSGITLEPKTRVPEPPRHIPYDRLSQLELRQNGSSVGKAVAIGVATGAATFFGIMLMMLAAYAD